MGDAFAYIDANVGPGEPSRGDGFTAVNLNVGFEVKPSPDGFAAVDMNVGFEKKLSPDALASLTLNVVGSTGITRWHNGYREALYAKGIRLNGATVPLAVKGHWNASTGTVDPLA